jgi:hypothetical protein
MGFKWVAMGFKWLWLRGEWLIHAEKWVRSAKMAFSFDVHPSRGGLRNSLFARLHGSKQSQA